jgi:large subunit ribosomal protein L4
MANIPLKDANNKELKTLKVSDRVFDDRRRLHIISEVVRYQMAKRRRGTHSAKTRSFISRSGAKPYAQKGTGRARRGDERSPGLEGGGVAFPPVARSYAFDLPKKARKAALRSVLSDKVRHERLLVLSEHGLKGIKTKEAKALMERLGVPDGLVVLGEKDEVLEKSLRNVPNVKVIRVVGLNVYDLLDYEYVVVMQDALPKIEEKLQ